MQSDEQNFFPHLIDNEENSFVTLWPSQTSLTASYSCAFWKYALSTVQKFLWASKKECFLWKSLELYNEKSVTCAIDLQQSFWFSYIAVHLLPFGHSVVLCMRNLFLKGDSSVFVFSFLFFFFFTNWIFQPEWWCFAIFRSFHQKDFYILMLV